MAIKRKKIANSKTKKKKSKLVKTSRKIKARKKVVTKKSATKNRPKKMAEFVKKFKDAGATILGGCCETTPAHIKEISKLV